MQIPWDNKVIFHEAVGAKIYKHFFFNFLFCLIKNVISNLTDVCKTIQMKIQKKKNNNNGLKIPTLPNTLRCLSALPQHRPQTLQELIGMS